MGGTDKNSIFYKGNAPDKNGKRGPGAPLKFTPERKEQFLAAFEKLRGYDAAAKAVGLSLATIMRHKHLDPEFVRRCKEIENTHTDQLEASAVTRAIEGTLKPIYREVIQRDAAGNKLKDSDGDPITKVVPVGAVKEFETGLTIWLLKTRKPRQYSDLAIRRNAITEEDMDILQREAESHLRRLTPQGLAAARTFLEEQRQVERDRETDGLPGMN